MSRFRRFVASSSLLLFVLYLFFPILTRTDNDTTSHNEAGSFTPAGITDQVLQTDVSAIERARPRELKDNLDTGSATYTLQERLIKEFPYDINSVFPGFIWQTWKTTPTDPDFRFREPEASWTEHHPGYIHEVITDDIASRLIHHLYANIPQVCEAYDSLPKPILKADFFRYLILFARGGIYSDIDTEALRPAWEWVPQDLVLEKYGLVIGIEADPDRPDWAEWYSRRVQFCQWTMRSKPGHPALLDVIIRLVEKTLAMKATGTLVSEGIKNVVEWTGPAVWTDAVFHYFNLPESSSVDIEATKEYSWRNLTGMTEAKKIKDVIILPITGFSPGQGHMGSEDFTDIHAMVKHDFEGSWKPESERMITSD